MYTRKIVLNKTYNKSRPNIPTDVSRAVKVEAGHTCAIKGCLEHTYLEIHHINDNREDNNLENLILLCDKHHKMSHSNVIDRKALRAYKKLLDIKDIESLLERFEKLESLLFESKLIESSTDPILTSINLILEEAVLLGNNLRGTMEGNILANQIFSLIKKHGIKMGVASIELMVLRDELYSRTGLIGLDILYDDYFEHTKSLKLKEFFKKKDLPQIVYYCALRENFPNEKNIALCEKAIEFSYEGLTVDCDSDYLFSKYINRGASAILDYVVYNKT